MDANKKATIINDGITNAIYRTVASLTAIGAIKPTQQNDEKPDYSRLTKAEEYIRLVRDFTKDTLLANLKREGLTIAMQSDVKE